MHKKLLRIKRDKFKEEKQRLSKLADQLIKQLDHYIWTNGSEIIVRVNDQNHIDIINRFNNLCKRIDKYTFEIQWVETQLRTNSDNNQPENQKIKNKLYKQLVQSGIISRPYEKHYDIT